MNFVITQTGVPLFIYAIFGYLFFLGFKTIKTGKVFLPRPFVVPLIFICTKIPFLKKGTPLELAAYASCLISAMIVAYLSLGSLKTMPVPNSKFYVILPGTYQLLIIVTIDFIIQNSFGVLMNMHPNIATHYLLQKHCYDAIISGFFLGQAITFVYKTLQTSKSESKI